MKKALKVIGKIIKWILIVLLCAVVLALIVRNIGRAVNSRAPKGGINETKYVDVNGQQMWINIYGENKDNPVLLYLHGGPGSSSSYADYVVLRKIAEDYTVVNWDQRNCGKTWLKDPQDKPITMEMMRSDIDVLADYLLESFGREKLTVMGMSWGSLYALDFAQRHPEKLDCCISLSTFVGYYDEVYYDEQKKDDMKVLEFLKTSDALSAEDREAALAIDPDDFPDSFPEEMTTDNENFHTYLSLAAKYNAEIQKYAVENGLTADLDKDADENFTSALFFGPYYTLPELCKTFLSFNTADNGFAAYDSLRTEIYDKEKNITVLDRTEYEMPVYMFLADKDNSAAKAEEYFNNITAPDKELRYTDGWHISTIYHSEELAAYVHEIAEKNKNVTF